ncbi:YbjN domain-containing protein [Aestuariivirga litoralis]|uniref:YbjN domain-containing protein n=1 Tax=Aestuariivirga litoralis TaxID=2650924 RepID=UPI0018C55D33|nr:YbjN domain-containing protein [Aestuariivirga litoralis]MBG1230972.1 hypothetical protein [Aestuariivirga litoralis]
MPASQHLERHSTNPLDRVEQLAEARSWRMDRTNDHEVVMLVGGSWSDLNISLTWRDDMESLHFACTLDLKVPAARRLEVTRLLNLINAQLLHGHFDLWEDGSILYRDALLLAGGAEVNEAQCETLIRAGVDATHSYYPAVNFVIWAGQPAEKALQNALLETMGEA